MEEQELNTVTKTLIKKLIKAIGKSKTANGWYPLLPLIKMSKKYSRRTWSNKFYFPTQKLGNTTLYVHIGFYLSGIEVGVTNNLNESCNIKSVGTFPLASKQATRLKDLVDKI